jgi:hypothetical protein
MPKNRVRFGKDFVLKDSKIGIGTTNPTTTLDITGDVKITSVGSTIGDNIVALHTTSNGGSLVYRKEDFEPTTDNLIFSITNEPDSGNPDLVYVISDSDALPLLSVSNSGVTTIRQVSVESSIDTPILKTPLVNFLVTGAASTTQITAKHYESNGGSLVFQSGINTDHLFSVTTEPAESGELYVINDNDGTSAFAVYDTGNVVLSKNVGIGTTKASANSKLTIQQASGSQALDIGTDFVVSASGAFNPKVTIGSSVGAASTEKMEISAVSRDNGLLEIANYGGNQLFSVSNNQSESAFSVYRYANYDNLSIASFENRNLFSVSPLGIVTTYGALRVGTSITTANSSVYNELYGRLSVRAPFSTTTEYVSIVPKFSDKGALSFEAPVGTAQTDRGTQIFSISNNLSSSIFRVNDLNRKPIFEASASGNAGIGTTNPQAKLQVNGNLRVTSAGSTATEQIDINHYNNFEYQVGIETVTFAGGAISFDSPAGISTDGVSLFPASLFAITNDPTGNIFSVGGYKYFSGSSVPAIDVTQSGRVGIGITNPESDFHIRSNTNATGNVLIRDRITFSEQLDFNRQSSTSVNIEPITPGVSTYAPTRGSILFQGELDQPLNGGQLVTVVNDNSSLFRINRFTGLSTNATGTRTIETAFEVSPSGNVGVGTSVPTSTLDVRGNANITGITTVGLGSTSSPTNNSTMSFELTNNTTLTIRVKGTDGVIRTGIVTLS